MNRRFNQLRRTPWGATRAIPALMILGAMNLVAPRSAWAQTMQAGQTAQGQQASVHSFSLKQAIDFAAQNSANVKNALLDYQIQEQSNRATTSAALPQIDGSAGITDYFQVPTSVFPGSFVNQPNIKLLPVAFGTKYNANYGITLKQVLFDGQVFVGLQARQASLDYYTKNRELTEQNLRVNICKIYYQLLLSRT